MSMLAERRRKTKWVINPTKKPIWTTDSEGIKLGKQLMEKMGWSAGKGLGAKEQGIQEPLKVSYKNDTKGMGFKGNDEDWLECQDEFNSFLSQLSSSDPSKPAEVNKNEVKSLEEKSKHSRARVHYQKFTRGKDLSRYSETDLACILGVNHNKKRKSSVKEKNPVKEKTDGNYETSFGVTTINSGSILDYFKKKWTIDKSKENNSSEALDKVTEDTLNNSEECKLTPEHKKGQKRKLDELDGENTQVPEGKTIKIEEVENSEGEGEVKKNKKSKKRKLNELDGGDAEVHENETAKGSEEVENFCNSEVGKESKKHKKSKKKKKDDLNIESESVSKAHKKEKYVADISNQIEENNQDIEVTVGVENGNSDNNVSLDDKKYDSLQLSREHSKDIDANVSKKRKKDKKKHKTNELDTLEENSEPGQEDFDHKTKKKKKKDKEKKEKDQVSQSEIKEVNGENNSDKNRHNSFTTDNEESKSVLNGDEKIQKLDLVEGTEMKNEVDLQSENSRKEKRRKGHKSNQLKLENEEELKIEAGEVESKSKKKKKKEKLSDPSILENEEEQEIKTEEILEEVEPVVKEKKKKGKHKTDESKLGNEEQERETKCTSEETDESKTKEKKKKDKHRLDQSTIENGKELEIKPKGVLEEAEPIVKEKKKKGKHKTDESKLGNEEQERETKYTSEETDESKTKEKKKKDKHRLDQSTVENEEEQVAKSKSVPEEIEPKVKEKMSKKNKSSESKKSKHKTESEGVDKSNINSESVEETNDDINTIQKQSEMLKKGEINTKVKEDCNKLANGNKPKEGESKTEESNPIHSHKFELFKIKKKETSLLGGLSKSPNNRVLGLIFGAEFDKFKGANIENLVGYGLRKEIKEKGDG